MATIAHAAAHICCSRAQFGQYLAKGVVTRQPSGQYDLDEVRREAFAHLRSVAAGRGGAAGDKLTAERVAEAAVARAINRALKKVFGRRPMAAARRRLAKRGGS